MKLTKLTQLTVQIFITGMASIATKEEDVAFMYRELPRKKIRLAEDAKRKRDGIRAQTMDEDSNQRFERLQQSRHV